MPLPTSSIRLGGGRRVLPPGDEFSPSVSFDGATYGDLTGDGRADAAVRLLYRTGGTANWRYLYVFTSVGGSPKLLAQLRSGSRADGGLVAVAIRDSRLILDFADTRRRIADCCSEGWVRVRYVWRGGRFVQEGPREYGTFR